MQAHGAARGVVTTPRHKGRLEVLLAIITIVVIATVMALLVQGVPPATIGADNASPGVGSAVVHDDAGNMPPGAGSVALHDDAGNVKPY